MFKRNREYPPFIGIEEVVSLWDELGLFPQTDIADIIISNKPPLLMVTELGVLVPAPDECRVWAQKFVLKCWRKPRLRYAAGRINSRVGWNADELGSVLIKDEGIELPAIEAPPAQEQPRLIADNSVASVTQPRQKLRDQEQAILAKIVDLGHNPKALPKNQNGKPGIRAECRKALMNSPLFTGPTTFKKAWERLGGEDIKYSD